MLRYLRIAASVACLIACLLLVALWARSYWWFDSLEIDMTPAGWNIDTFPGLIQIDKQQIRSRFFWEYRRDPVVVVTRPNGVPSFLDFYADGTLSDWVVGIPYWCPVTVTATLAILIAHPWITWRFSLRTLLLATTLLAGLLTTIVFALK